MTELLFTFKVLEKVGLGGDDVADKGREEEDDGDQEGEEGSVHHIRAHSQEQNVGGAGENSTWKRCIVKNMKRLDRRFNCTDGLSGENTADVARREFSGDAQQTA